MKFRAVGRSDPFPLYIIGIVIAVVLFGYWVAFSNYGECRSKGFSRLYCASTTLVR